MTPISGNPNEYMQLALSLAKKSRPSPNPRVGAVVVKDGHVIGTGYHLAPGEPHAEVCALAEAGSQARGADLYVTLEPCCHQGRTGPCTRVIQSSGLSRVFIGMIDPDPRVRGAGAAFLREMGLEVHCDVLHDECHQMLAGYAFHRIHGRPFVTLKAAITLDGCLACTSGDSKWISTADSRRLVHEMRAFHDAVLVGVDTVIADNPKLTVRDAPGETPLRIILDSNLRTPASAALFDDAAQNPVLIAHVCEADERIQRQFSMSGVALLRTAADENGRVQLPELLTELGHRGVLSVMVEGGAKIHGAFITTGTANAFALFVSPKIIGRGIPWASFPGVCNISDAVCATELKTLPIGKDILLTGQF